MGHTNALIIAGALLLRFLIFYSADTFDQADNIPCADDEVQPVFISNDVAETVAGINSNRHLWKCHFDKTYHRMRTNFIEMAKKSSLSIYSYPLENYPDLTTDVAVIEGSKFNSNILVHISGTHGPEGYAGSATQHAFLEQYYECMHNETCAEIVKTRYPTIVLVHANNAYGFANNRRFTEENVDLNRNFLTSAEFDEVISRDHNFAGYVNLDPVINPTTAAYFKIPADARPPIPYGEPNAPVFLTQEWIDEHKIRAMLLANDAVTLFNTFIAVMKYGMLNVKKALVSGNYYKPTGVYYGGNTLTNAARNLNAIARDVINVQKAHLNASTRLNDQQEGIIIDVHTGLGDSGVDTIVSDLPVDEDMFEELWPTEYSTQTGKKGVGKKNSRKDKNTLSRPKTTIVGGLKDSMGDGTSALAGYGNMTGGVCQGFVKHWFLPELSMKHKICATQEFGTKHMIFVGQAAVTENYAHHYGTEVEKAVYGETLKDAFFVDTKAWKSNVARRGLIVMAQAIHRLML